MYLFFLFFFVFVCVILIFFILLQPGKGLNNTTHLNTKNNIKFFNNIGSNNFTTNIIGIFSCLFLFISIILCNINNRTTDPDFFLEDNMKNTIKKESFLDKQELNSDIPH